MSLSIQLAYRNKTHASQSNTSYIKAEKANMAKNPPIWYGVVVSGIPKKKEKKKQL